VHPPSAIADLRGASRLVTDLTLLVTDVVETMHHNIARHPGPLGDATLAPTKGITGFVYRSVRGVTHVAGGAVDRVLAPLVPLLARASPWPGREPLVCALNGVLGDRLEATGNPLAIAMQLRHQRKALPMEPAALAAAIPGARPRVLVMVHGLCMGDSSWNRNGHDHGECLARDLDADVLYLRYNTGRHISTNGAEFALQLEQLVAAWPVPVRELVLVGHSMGGLVNRSACLVGETAQHAWRRRLKSIVFLGTPHHGAPMERGGHGLDRLFGASPYTVAFSRLAQLRSAGITDLRHGALRDEDWRHRDRFAHGGYLHHALPLPRKVGAFAVAGSASKAPAVGNRAPRGDGLVPVATALGTHDDVDRDLHIPAERRWIAYGTRHLELLGSHAVYMQMRAWLAAGRS
jgi:PGAP1-like protein